MWRPLDRDRIKPTTILSTLDFSSSDHIGATIAKKKISGNPLVPEEERDEHPDKEKMPQILLHHLLAPANVENSPNLAAHTTEH